MFKTTLKTFCVLLIICISQNGCTNERKQNNVINSNECSLDSLLHAQIESNEVDSILHILYENTIINDYAINILSIYNYYLKKSDIFDYLDFFKTCYGFDTYNELICWADSIYPILDSLDSKQHNINYPYNIKHNATWRYMKTAFTSKGYSLGGIRDYSEPQFIKNKKFSGSGCPLQENPSYGRIIPERVLDRPAEKYKKYDPKTKFWYLYTNRHVQSISKKNKYNSESATVEYYTFGDSVMNMKVSYRSNIDMREVYIDKYGYPLHENSIARRADTLTTMFWDFKNMIVIYLSRKDNVDSHINVEFINKRLYQCWENYQPIIEERRRLDYEKEKLNEQRRKDSIRQAKEEEYKKIMNQNI